MPVGGYAALQAVIFPANASSQTVSWISANPAIATVTNGKVKAVSEGTTIIYCTSLDNTELVKSCEVTVVSSSSQTPSLRKKVVVGQIVKIGRLKYKVSRVNADGTGEAALTGSVTKKLTTLNIPDTIRIEGKNFKVTSVEKKAFQNCRKLKKVVFGKYVSAVRAQAFMGCRSLKSVQIKGKALRSISTGAFKKTSAKMTVSAKKLSKKQKAGLMKKFRKAGMSKKAKMR